MIKVENIDVWGFEHAIRGMRNPMNSWSKSDTKFVFVGDGYREPIGREVRDYDKIPAHFRTITTYEEYPIHTIIGEKDLDLMRRLYKAGTEHRKYLRQIMVSMDITAPLYWWKEFDTYKVGTVANSCSTMHKIAAKEFELGDFSHEHLLDESIELFNANIDELNSWRNKYIIASKVDDIVGEELLPDKKTIWWQLIQLLPSSYNQKRTVTMNYENVITIIKQRTGHKLDEWNELIKVLRKLPYIEEIMGGE